MQKLRQYLDKITPLNESEWELAKVLFKKRQIVRKEYFTKPGEISNEIGFIDKGLFRFYYVID